MSLKAKLGVVSVLALLVTAPAGAQTVHEGDYYAPDKTVVQQPTAAQIKQGKEGDYYSTEKTDVEQPSSAQVRQDKQGDYYAPSTK